MKVTIIIEGIERTYQGEYEELHNRDWNERVREHLDDAKEYVENPVDEIPQFKGTYADLERITIALEK